jgi:hypothetical protein
MTEELIKYIATCYFWLYIIYLILQYITVYSDDFQRNRNNAIRNGNWFKPENLMYSFIRTLLFLIAIKLM